MSDVETRLAIRLREYLNNCKREDLLEFGVIAFGWCDEDVKTLDQEINSEAKPL